MKRLLLLVLLGSLATSATAQTQYYDCKIMGGTLANVSIKSALDSSGAPLDDGDEVAVFNADGLCVGSLVWRTNTGNGLAVQGTDAFAGKGMDAGEVMKFRIYDVSAQAQFEATPTYSFPQGSIGAFSGGGIYIVSIQSGAEALPVELTSFNGFVDGTDVVLNWSTATERNNAGFEVEHSPDGRTFEQIGFLEGAGTTQASQTYTFRTNVASKGINYYRLRQVDFDGASEYSPIIEVAYELPVPYLLEAAYPNPFNPTTRLAFSVSAEAPVRLAVYDILGREVRVLFDGVAPAARRQEILFDGTGLPSGLYVYRLEGKSFRETRQVLLLK